MTHHLPKAQRKGIGCLPIIGGAIAIVIVVALVAAFLANSYVKSITGKPLNMPPEPDAATVTPALEKRYDAAITPLAPGKDTTLTMSSDEVDVLIRQAYPQSEAEKLRIELKDGKARIMLSMKGPQLEKQLPPEFPMIRRYVSGLPFVNLDFGCLVTYENKRWNFQVRSVKQPEGITPAQIQSVVEGLTSQNTQGPAKLKLAGKETNVTKVELKDDTALVTVQK
jgi:hypothetical protein